MSWITFLASLVLRQPPAELRALRFPETFSIPRAPGVSHPRGLERARVRTPGLGSNSAPPPFSRLLAVDLGGQGAPAATPHSVSQRPPPQSRRAGHRLGPGLLAPPSAPPSAPAGHGRSGPRAATARSLPASGQHRSPAPLSVSRRRPRRGLRLYTAGAGAAVQAPAPAGCGRSSPAASRPRRAPAPLVCEAAAAAATAAEPAESGAHSRPAPSLPLPPGLPALLPPPRPPLRPGGGARTDLVPLGGDPDHRVPKTAPPPLTLPPTCLRPTAQASFSALHLTLIPPKPPSRTPSELLCPASNTCPRLCRLGEVKKREVSLLALSSPASSQGSCPSRPTLFPVRPRSLAPEWPSLLFAPRGSPPLPLRPEL